MPRKHWRCEDCMYFDSEHTHNILDKREGFCSRYAPRPRVAGVGDIVWAAWPVVMIDDWCGEWQSEPELRPETDLEIKY